MTFYWNILIYNTKTGAGLLWPGVRFWTYKWRFFNLKWRFFNNPSIETEDFWFLILIFDFWFLIFGFWFLIFDFWFLISDFWFLISDFWFLNNNEFRAGPSPVGISSSLTMMLSRWWLTTTLAATSRQMWVKNHELCIQKNGELCIKNEEFCILNDEFCRFSKAARITVNQKSTDSMLLAISTRLPSSVVQRHAYCSFATQAMSWFARPGLK